MIGHGNARHHNFFLGLAVGLGAEFGGRGGELLENNSSYLS